jgi:hypothetical protein
VRYALLLIAAAIILAGCTRGGISSPDMDTCRAVCPSGTRALATLSDNIGVWKCGCVDAPEVRLTCVCGDKPGMSIEEVK